MSSAISLFILFFSSFMAIFSLAVAEFCGIFVFLIILMYNRKYGICVYLVVISSSIFFVPNKESVFLYIFFFGLYPILYFNLNKIKNKALKIISKLAFFSMFSLIINLIFFYIFSFYENVGSYVFILYFFCFLAAFFVFDYCLLKFIVFYQFTLKNILKKFL